jgi:hypothetical protein
VNRIEKFELIIPHALCESNIFGLKINLYCILIELDNSSPIAQVVTEASLLEVT